jgi:hypothetical protein
LSLLAGFRYIELNESLSIVRDTFCLTPGCGDGVTTVSDNFGTRNRFFGGQVGVDYEYRTGRWIFGANGKVALGDMYQSVAINGVTAGNPAEIPAGGPVTLGPTGLLAQGSNSGRFHRDRFAVVPEVGLKVGYQITDNLSVFAGYSVLYMSDVVRPGEQIDLVVDKNGNLHPRVPFRGSGVWIQGFNGGLEWKY